MFFIFFQRNSGKKEYKEFHSEEKIIEFLLEEGKELIHHRIFFATKVYKLGLIKDEEEVEKKKMQKLWKANS